MKRLSLICCLILFFFCMGNAMVWYVHPDSMLNTIQAGLDSCSTNDTVLVGPGVYPENIVWPDSQGIVLMSESGPETTVISGGNTGTVVTIYGGIDSTAALIGFTLRNAISTMFGAGILCHSSSPLISGNIITENSGYLGGGIALLWQSSPLIQDNTITYNSASTGGGIYLRENSNPLVIGNVIMYNSVNNFGGGVYCEEASPHFTLCSIDSNFALNGYGAGLAFQFGYTPVLDSCSITGNSGDGVRCSNGVDLVVNYCNIVDNDGYGVINYDSTIIVNAENNWWGDASGPGGVGPGSGDEVNAYVDYDPWLTQPGTAEIVQQLCIPYVSVYPNPFNKRIWIEIDHQDPLFNTVRSVEIYDIRGCLVKTISLPATISHISWNGCDESGKTFPSGVYFIRYKTGFQTATHKVILSP